MIFALVDGERRKATPHVQGFCPYCNEKVIAKCGEQRIAHWAHAKNTHCEGWWESETDWHLNWKARFPAEWQEVIHHDPRTNERHVADVKTGNGVILEFQHSHIHPEERRSRESFYQNMLWVVDGTRCKGDYPRFLKAFSGRPVQEQVMECIAPRSFFPKDWLESQVPVVFDFSGGAQVIPSDDPRNFLYCFWRMPYMLSEGLRRILQLRHQIEPGQRILPMPLLFCLTFDSFLTMATKGNPLAMLSNRGRHFIHDPVNKSMRILMPRRPQSRRRTFML